MNKKIFFLILSILFCFKIFSENFNFFVRSTFADAQFWEYQTWEIHYRDSNNNLVTENKYRRVFTNFFSGSIGIGLEMIIWDMGKKRGSRIYAKNGIDIIFLGPSYFGIIEGTSPTGTMKSTNLNGGAFYLGVDIDLYLGGTFPKTDLFWGIGSIFHFVFPTYSPKISLDKYEWYEFGAFYATPSLVLGYDIFIPNSNFKISPQIRTGFTCNPLVPDALINGIDNYHISKTDSFSGFYLDISIAFTFFSVQWKK